MECRRPLRSCSREEAIDTLIARDRGEPGHASQLQRCHGRLATGAPVWYWHANDPANDPESDMQPTAPPVSAVLPPDHEAALFVLTNRPFFRPMSNGFPWRQARSSPGRPVSCIGT